MVYNRMDIKWMQDQTHNLFECGFWDNVTMWVLVRQCVFHMIAVDIWPPGIKKKSWPSGQSVNPYSLIDIHSFSFKNGSFYTLL